MTVPNIKSSHNAETRNIINRAIDVINQQGRSIQDLVAKGQLTPQQYSRLLIELNGLIKKGDVGIADIDINKGKITQSMIAEEVIEMIAGTSAVNAVPADGAITKNKMAQRSIGFDELSIAERSSKNLFSGSYYFGWLAHWTSGTPSGADKITLTMRANQSDFDGRTAVIKVKPNTTYSVRVADERDAFRVAVLNRDRWHFEMTHSADENATDQTFIEGFYGSEINDGRVRLTTGSDARYLLITVSRSGQEPRLMVEEGSAYSPYESGSRIPIDYLESEGGTHNLRFLQGRVATSGVVQYGPDYSSLILDKPIRLSKGFVIGLHDYSDFSINIARWDVGTGEYLSSYGRRTGHTLTEEYADFQIVLQRVDETFDYTEADLKAAKELVFVEYAGESAAISSKAFTLTDDIEHDFEAFGVKDYGGEQDEARNVLHTEVYQDIDVVRWQNDQYIFRESQGTSVSGNTIYSYHLRPHNLETRSGVNAPAHPKVIIIAGVHGNEKSTSFAVATLIKLLADHWRENKLLEFLRFNVEFAIIPVANPDGFDSYSRRNANDVDINRDFPELWERITEGSSKNGTEPLSQPESVIISNFIQTHNDAVLGIDYHNMFFQSDAENCTFATSVHAELAQMMNKVQMTAHRHWIKKYDFFPQDDTKSLGYVTPGAVGTVSRHITATGVPGTTLEVNRTNEWQNKETFGQFDTVVNAMSLELLVETIKSRIKTLM